jgi:outer membrane protein assembly factor BamB
MPLEQLIFIGLNRYVVALHRDTGEIVWSNNQLHDGAVTLLLDGDRLIASSNGYIYCLNPHTGKILWHNPMKGYGRAAPTALASVRGQVNVALIEELVAQQQAAAASSAAAAASV